MDSLVSPIFRKVQKKTVFGTVMILIYDNAAWEDGRSYISKRWS
jgi:hypothetical protein